MARRGPKPKIQAGTSAASVEVTPPVQFVPLDTSWVDTIEDQIIDPVPDEPEPDPDPGPTDPLMVRPVTDADVDRLWDWVRQDTDRGLAFLGFQPKTAREVYGHFAQTYSGNPATAAFAIEEQGRHIGFVLFNPIHPTTLHAVTHLYFAPEAQGRFAELVPALLRLCDEQYPKLALVAVTPDGARMRLYRSAGFTVSYVLTRPARGGA